MEDTFNLNRFVEAQQDSYKTALSEIKNGSKESHWMWYIFPQLKGLGRTSISEKYAIKSKNEALEYLNHKVLGVRLVEISNELLKVESLTTEQILGFPDMFKLKSSMSLFASIQKEELIFKRVLDKYFNGNLCKTTLKFLE